MSGDWHFLVTLNERLRPLRDPVEIQKVCVWLIAEHLEVSRVNYVQIEGDEFVVRRSYGRTVAPFTGRGPVAQLGTAVLDACRRGETIVVSDAHTDPRLMDAEREHLLANEVAAFVGVPITKEGRCVAMLGVQSTTPRVWTRDQIALVELTSERIWGAGERARAEDALEASAGGSWTWVAATNQVYWDEQFRLLYGFATDEPATPAAWVTRVHEDDRPRMLALRQEMRTSKAMQSWDSTYRIVRPNGTVAWIQSLGRVERDADGNVTRLTGLDLDFSQHRLTEEAQQARRDEEHDRALRTLLETATQGIVSVDDAGVIVTTNRAIEAMFGWGVGELIGHRIEDLLPSTFRGAHVRHRVGYVAAPRARFMGGGLDLVGQRKDGSTFPIEVSLNHVPTSSGGHTFAFVTDISERRRAASALQERTAELEYRTTQLSQMASDVTLAEQRAREQIAKTLHDGLQQLLVIAELNVEQQLKRDSDRGAVPSELLSEASRQLKDAIAAARSLNIELFPPVLQRSGLPAALAWLADWTNDKYKLNVLVVADPRADSARKDVRTLLFESVRELLFNAVKYAQADRVTLELTLDTDDQLCITVSDQGIGFDPAELDYRSTRGHVGWGLFSIRERLTLLGGSVDIDSAPGKGTRVRLVAPRGHAHAAVADTVVLSVTPNLAAPAEGNSRAIPTALRILLVDDHPAVCSSVRNMLHQHSELSVIGEASNGFEAIARAHTLRPDVILMDISMPHMDGVEATARLHRELPDIQIFGLSMQPRSTAAEAIEQAGAAGFFVKGIDTGRMIEQLLVVHAARGARTPA